jgi:hypothetical protein
MSVDSIFNLLTLFNAYQRFFILNLLRDVDFSQSTSVEFLPCDHSTDQYL